FWLGCFCWPERIAGPPQAKWNGPLSEDPRRGYWLGKGMDGSEGVDAGEVLSRVKAGTLSLGSAATLLAVSYRQAKRLARRYQAEGAKGLKHRSAGRASNHARPTADRERALAVVREKDGGPVAVRFGPRL